MNSFTPVEQVDINFDEITFAENPEPRCPVVLLLDTSWSMTGQPINELNQALQEFWKSVGSDTLAAKRVEVAVVTFGPVLIMQDFATVTNSTPPTFTAKGTTPIGEAVIKGCGLLQERKKLYKQNGIAYFKPWMVLITDGAPTDDISEAIEALTLGEKQNAMSLFCIGVSDADMTVLSRLSPNRDPLKLKGLCFSEFFLWLSASVTSVSQSQLGEIVPLQSPKGWAEI